MPNDNMQSNQDTNPLIDNKTVIFTSLSGYLAFSGNLVVEITDKVLQHKIKYLSLAVDVHNGVVSGIVKSTSTDDPMRIAATIGMEVVGEKAGAIIGGGIQVAKHNGIKMGGKFIAEQSAKTLVGKTLAKVGFNVLTRIATGAATGAVVGSSFPIVGTIVGAVVGAVVTGLFSDLAYDYLSGEKAKQEAQEQKEKELEEIYVRKIQRINAYTMQNRLIQTRYFTEEESKILNEYLTNPYISYFQVILFYLSCPNLVDVYVGEDTNIKELTIKPIANAISITLEIDKCYDDSNMNKAHTDKLLINKTIYVYNKRFKRVVAKTQTDENGKAVFTEVFVGKEHTIDELRFMVDRDNLSERVA